MSTVYSTFIYTGAQQTFTVPALVTSIRIALWGADGGGEVEDGNGKFADAAVGFVAGTLAVTPGAVYYIYVGGEGGDGGIITGTPSTTNGGLGGYNGGGKGGYFAGSDGGYINPGCGGGGATDIRSGGTALSNRIAVAGGQGGNTPFTENQFTGSLTLDEGTTPIPPYGGSAEPVGGWAGYWSSSTQGGYGGYGGPATGQAGGNATNTTGTTLVANTGGKGGGAAAGGAGGVSAGTGSSAGSAGASGTGGQGGVLTAAQFADYYVFGGGGGGGGGYFGGGGGAVGFTDTNEINGCSGGGGGGSNYISGSFTATVNLGHIDEIYYMFSPGIPSNVEQAMNNPGGFALITYDQPPNAPSITNPAPNAYIDANSDLEVLWTYSSLDVTTHQGGFDIEYQAVGAGSWTAFSFPTSQNKTYTFPSGTFTAGTAYNIRLLNYDNFGDASPFTEITINAVDLPQTPVITQPTEGQVFTSDTFDATWTIEAGKTENLYRIQIYDPKGGVVLDTGDVSVSRINLCTNPDFETNTTGWTNGIGSTTQSATYAKFGTYSLKQTWGTSGANGQSLINQFDTIPGQVYNVSAWVTLGNVSTDPQVQIAVANPGFLPFAEGETSAVVTAGTFVQISMQFIAQQTTTQVLLQPTAACTGSQLMYLDAVLIEAGSNALPTPMNYFDGGNANGNPGTPSWLGTAHASQSVLTVANVLTQAVDWTGNPSEDATIYLTYSTVEANGLYSQQATADFSVNLNPPPTPEVTLTPDDDTGSIEIAIVNPSGTYPATYNDVFRTDLTNGTEEIRIATRVTPNTTLTDYTPATRTLYGYRIRAYSSDGGYADAD